MAAGAVAQGGGTGVPQAAGPQAGQAALEWDYDVLLQGGRVLDPANDLDAVRDIGIRGGKIVAVGRKLSPKRARRVLSVSGKLVLPGLVDIHVHGFGYFGSLGLEEHAFMNGTTTVVDAGGGGWKTFDGLEQALRPRPRGRFGFPGGLGDAGGGFGGPPGGGTRPGSLEAPRTPGGSGGVGGNRTGGGTPGAPGNAGPRGPGDRTGGGAGGAGGPGGGGGFDPARQGAFQSPRLRTYAFLNIVGEGMVGGRAENNMADMDAEKAAACVAAHPDLLIGIKTAHFGGPTGEQGWTAVDRAVKAGQLCGKPVMVDFQPRPDRPYPELLLKRMRPHDIHTHVFAQHFPVLDESGKVQSYMWEARRRGIIFDVGHGGGSFWFRVAAPAIQQGFYPDSISTDMHKTSIMIPQSTMPMVMSKLLNLGMPMREVVLRSTVHPARQISHPELGTLSVGADADVSVFELEEGDFGFVDSGHAGMRGKKRLRCHLTLRNGLVAFDLNGLSWKDWRQAGQYRDLDQYGQERRRGFRRPAGTPNPMP